MSDRDIQPRLYLAPPSRDQILALEREMLALPQVEVPTSHLFGAGFYARTITIPAGATLTGKVHKTEHIFMIVKGDITLVTEDAVKRVQAPFQVVSRPGVKRVGYAHTDVVCVNIHITDEQDLDKLEATLVESEGLQIATDTKESVPWHGSQQQ